MLAQEIERINLVLRSKIEENSNLETRNRNLQQELDGHKKGIADY
jgi:regulator of replication initiation timing